MHIMTLFDLERGSIFFQILRFGAFLLKDSEYLYIITIDFYNKGHLVS